MITSLRQWGCGLVIMHWSRSTKLLYVGTG